METYKGIEITIKQEEYPENPREAWDNLCTMVCFHNRYNLGDVQGDDPVETLEDILCENDVTFESDHYHLKTNEDHMDYLFEKLDKIAFSLPLYLYDHSGITMNTGGFSCPWDSGQVGFIYVTKEAVRKEWKVKRISPKLRKQIYRNLKSEVETYDQYLTGDVYGFICEDPEGYVDEDSCWGFYGYKDCLDEARSIATWMHKEKIKAKIDLGKASLLRNLLNVVTTA